MTRFRARWSRSLIVASAIGSGLILFVTVLVMSSGQVFDWLLLVPLAVLVGSAAFMIRGYTIGQDAILVHRLFSATRLPRAGLESAAYEPDAMRGGLRVFGNGGLFVVAGWFYNRRLGKYRALVSDPRRAVVLRYRSRTIVISPEDPERFIDELNRTKQTA